jgi:hypothetical protein
VVSRWPLLTAQVRGIQNNLEQSRSECPHRDNGRGHEGQKGDRKALDLSPRLDQRRPAGWIMAIGNMSGRVNTSAQRMMPDVPYASTRDRTTRSTKTSASERQLTIA